MTDQAPASGAAHTPGPWEIHRQAPRITIRATNGRAIAYMSGTTAVMHQEFADAWLIAAAPDLLARVKADIDNLHFWAVHPNGNPETCPTPSCVEGRALIAKAEGR